MGYLYNHLATVVSGIFAIVLSIMWIVLVPIYPVLQFVFIMAVPIMWFMVLMCWLSQKSTDYVMKHPSHSSEHTHETIHKELEKNELDEIKIEFGAELESLRKTVEIKEDQIEDLKKRIKNLETQVQIETLRAELTELKHETKSLR